MEAVPVEKDEERELPVPSAWRPTLTAIAEALRNGNFELKDLDSVEPLGADDALRNADRIAAYGATLARLPDAAWASSVCQWLVTHWSVLVDLYTVEEGRSDLVLHALVWEEADTFRFKVHMVYVP